VRETKKIDKRKYRDEVNMKVNQENEIVNNTNHAILGIEFGSTRIKAVLIDRNGSPIINGSHDWENRLENGFWTYSLNDIWSGLQDCYRDLKDEYQKRFGVPLVKVDGIGFSAMMHGYMAFDENHHLLVPFRTWRNTTTGPAAEKLSELFNFNIPQRWSIAHLYQAILNQEPHVKEIRYLTTLAGYVHWQLTGKKVLGIGDASGMFPIDSTGNDFDARMIKQFDQLVEQKGYPWKLKELLPEVLLAGAEAGVLTPEGAKLLDPSGLLQAGIPFCPPEGDAGTGMVATNSVAERTCNVSAGTSVFAMVVLEKALAKQHPEIDMVTTPTGKPVAMVHANTCTSDLNSWVNLFDEVAKTFGNEIEPSKLYETLFNKAMEGDADCGGLLAYNLFSGEPVVHLDSGTPLFVRTPESHFTLANFMRSHLYSAVATLKIGMDLLLEEEKVRLDQILGHGGFFKTKGVGQRIMAAAINVPVSVMETAGEGGPWGMALLSSYQVNRKQDQSLESYLSEQVFTNAKCMTEKPVPEDVAGFNEYMIHYKLGLSVESEAGKIIK
jgi:sugar (pentulose or hexulose) kinase